VASPRSAMRFTHAPCLILCFFHKLSSVYFPGLCRSSNFSRAVSAAPLAEPTDDAPTIVQKNCAVGADVPDRPDHCRAEITGFDVPGHRLFRRRSVPRHLRPGCSAGSFRIPLWRRQKENPRRLATRDSYWSGILEPPFQGGMPVKTGCRPVPPHPPASGHARPSESGDLFPRYRYR
jgi:hypothetical protein